MTRNTAGVTLLEFLLILALIATVVLVGLPGLQTVVESNRARTDVNALHSSLMLSRESAIRRGLPVVLCRTNTGGACTRSPGSWSDGWKVFEAPRGETGCAEVEPGMCDHGGTIIHVQHGTKARSGTLVHNSNIRNFVRFGPQGMAGNHNGRLTWCTADGRPERGLVILRTGRVRTAARHEFLDC